MGYLSLTLLLGWIVGRRARGVRDYFVASGRLPWVILMPFLMAEYLATAATVGAAEMAHDQGLVSMWWFLAAPIGLTILAYGLAGFYTSIRKVTLGEAFAVLFDSKTRAACVFFLLLSTVMIAGNAFLALGTVVAPMLGLAYETGVWLSAVFLAVVAVAGGLRGVAVVNIIHLFVIVSSFTVAAIASVNAAGGLAQLAASLPPEHLDPLSVGWPTVSAWVITSAAVKLISVMAVSAMFAARAERDAKIAAVSAGLLIALFAVLPTLIGLTSYVLMPDAPSRLALWNMGEYLGPAMSTVLSLGVIGAIISTTPAILLSIGAIAARDVLLAVRPDADESTQLILSRASIPVLALASAGFALTQPSIMHMLLRVGQLRVVFAVVMLVAVLWRRIHPFSAFWTTVLGALGWLGWFAAGSPLGVEPLWPALLISFVVLVVTSLVRRPLPFRGVEGLDLPGER